MVVAKPFVTGIQLLPLAMYIALQVQSISFRATCMIIAEVHVGGVLQLQSWTGKNMSENNTYHDNINFVILANM